MANSTIDTLQVKISANATDASKALNSLATSLKKVRSALSGVSKDGLHVSEQIAQSLTEMNAALAQISTGSIKKLQKLADALNKYGDACKSVKQAGDISRQIKAVQKTLDATTGRGANTSTALVKYAESSTELATIMKPLVKYQGAGGITKAVSSSTALVPLGGKSGIDLSDALDAMERVTNEGMAAKVRMSLGLWTKFKYEFKEFKKHASESLDKVKERLNGLNLGAKRSNVTFSKLMRTFGRIALYRAIRSAIKAVGQAFEEGLKNAYLYSQQTEGFERLANSLDRVKSLVAQMTNQLGAFYGEFKQFIQPAVEWLIEKVRQLSEFLTELFAGLNGSDVYQYALLEDLKWQEATEDLKKYKQQLLGLDEINNLTTQTKSGKEEEDATTKYELRPVRESFRAVGAAWQSVKQTIEEAYKEIGDLAYLPLGMLALGSILLFTGHPLLGIALVMKGVQWTIQEYEYNNEENRAKIEGFFKEYEGLFNTASTAAIAVGTMLLFVPGFRALGLGLLLGGNMLKNLVHNDVKFSWGGLLKTIEDKFEKYKGLFEAAGWASTAIGTILLFVPGFRKLGLGLIMAGVTLSSLAKELPAISWGGLLSTITDKFNSYSSLFVKGAIGATVVGVLLLFVPGMRGVGLKLIRAAFPGLFIAGMKVDWSSLIADIKAPFQNALTWIDEWVIKPLQEKWYTLEKLLHKDLNDDGDIGRPNSKPPVVKVTMEDAFDSATKKLREGITDLTNEEKQAIMEYQKGFDPNIQAIDLYKGIASSAKDNWLYQIFQWLPASLLPKSTTISKKAAGGIASNGSLFYAGEAGPEFIGSMGNTSAVANTGQMTDAIYKAAYMGMSRALQENGGNGLAGFEPASTDDLFIAMKKKSSAYTKRTGQSAFA